MGLGISFWTSIPGHAITDDGLPVAEVERLGGFTLFFGDRLKFALEIEPGKLSRA